jgi:hypothetical protein
MSGKTAGARDAQSEAPVPTTASVCGLPCDACSIFIASHEDPVRLAAIAARFGHTAEETYCDGCRADAGISSAVNATIIPACTWISSGKRDRTVRRSTTT